MSGDYSEFEDDSKSLEPLAIEGLKDPAAQFSFALALGSLDPDSQLLYLESLVDQNNTSAQSQFLMAKLLQQKRGSEQRIKQLLEAAAQQNYPPAQYALARLMQEEVVQKVKDWQGWDYRPLNEKQQADLGQLEEPIKVLLEQAAKQNYAPAQYRLAMVLDPANSGKRKRELLVKASEKGHAGAWFELFRISPPGSEEALKYYSEAIRRGYQVDDSIYNQNARPYITQNIRRFMYSANSYARIKQLADAGCEKAQKVLAAEYKSYVSIKKTGKNDGYLTNFCHQFKEDATQENIEKYEDFEDMRPERERWFGATWHESKWVACYNVLFLDLARVPAAKKNQKKQDKKAAAPIPYLDYPIPSDPREQFEFAVALASFDSILASQILRLAAAQNYAPAQFRLALLIEKEREQAATAFQKTRNWDETPGNKEKDKTREEEVKRLLESAAAQDYQLAIIYQRNKMTSKSSFDFYDSQDVYKSNREIVKNIYGYEKALQYEREWPDVLLKKQQEAVRPKQEAERYSKFDDYDQEEGIRAEDLSEDDFLPLKRNLQPSYKQLSSRKNPVSYWLLGTGIILSALAVGGLVFGITAGVANISIGTAFSSTAVLASLGAGSVALGAGILAAAILVTGLIALGIFALLSRPESRPRLRQNSVLGQERVSLEGRDRALPSDSLETGRTNTYSDVRARRHGGEVGSSFGLSSSKKNH